VGSAVFFTSKPAGGVTTTLPVRFAPETSKLLAAETPGTGQTLPKEPRSVVLTVRDGEAAAPEVMLMSSMPTNSSLPPAFAVMIRI
jgi:hypothetical protein